MIDLKEFYSLFIKNREDQEKENKELKDAFKNITLDKNESIISMKRLRDVSTLYDKKYKNSVIYYHIILYRWIRSSMTWS